MIIFVKYAERLYNDLRCRAGLDGCVDATAGRAQAPVFPVVPSERSSDVALDKRTRAAVLLTRQSDSESYT